jgi:hypothetical protein
MEYSTHLQHGYARVNKVRVKKNKKEKRRLNYGTCPAIQEQVSGKNTSLRVVMTQAST